MSFPFSPRPARASQDLHPKQPARTPAVPTATTLPPRLVLLHGLQTDAGEPVMAVATGSIRRPHLRAFSSTADALAALHAAGGGA